MDGKVENTRITETIINKYLSIYLSIFPSTFLLFMYQLIYLSIYIPVHEIFSLLFVLGLFIYFVTFISLNLTGKKRETDIYYTYMYIYIYIYILPGKDSASWQLVAVVMGLKTMQRGKNDVKLPKSTQNQSKNSPRP